MFNHQPLDYICPICNLVNGKESEFNKLSDIVFENERILAFISPKWWPNNPGNVMVVPKPHFENIYDIPDELLGELNIVAKKIAVAMRTEYKCDGISTRQHNEPSGNQDLWHFHLHVFPRWKNDNLYLNNDKSEFIDSIIREPYAKKLKSCLKAT
jgi:histidine triad (HIT) family protein